LKVIPLPFLKSSTYLPNLGWLINHLYILSEDRKKSIEERIIKGVVGRPGMIIPIAPREKLIIPKII
jgi:hypothetical protein